MIVLIALMGSLVVLLLCWPFCRPRLQYQGVLRSRRMTGQQWGRERLWQDRIAPYLGLKEADQLCQHAGRPWGVTGIALLQYQWLSAFICLFLFASISVPFAMVGGALAWFMPRLLLSQRAHQRKAQIALELPAFLDLWGLLVSSGEGVESALVEICRRHPDWLLASEMRRVLERVSASGLFGESLVEEAKVTGSQEFVSVAEQISHLVEGGGLPSRELARMAEQMREQRVTELMQSAGAMAVAGIFPKLGAVFLSLIPVLATIILTVKKHL